MGTPIDIYKRPKTSFVSQFIGTSAVLNNFDGFRGYDHMPGQCQTIIRPEFVEVFKSDNKKFKSLIPASEEGVIREIAFRGSYLELTVEVNGILLTTNRSLERRPVKIGEHIRVLIYRIYLLEEGGAQLFKNKLLEGVDVDAL